MTTWAASQLAPQLYWTNDKVPISHIRLATVEDIERMRAQGIFPQIGLAFARMRQDQGRLYHIRLCPHRNRTNEEELVERRDLRHDNTGDIELALAAVHREAAEKATQAEAGDK